LSYRGINTRAVTLAELTEPLLANNRARARQLRAALSHPQTPPRCASLVRRGAERSSLGCPLNAT